MGFPPDPRRPALDAMLITDEDAWLAYPAARAFYDRQWLATQLGFVNGPAGTKPEKAGRYFVKPVRNLLGMGIGAKAVEYSPGGAFEVAAGCFWSECFTGEHLSIDYRRNRRARRWAPVCCVKGEFDGTLPLCWVIQPRWRRLPVLPALFEKIGGLCDAARLNVEFIGGKVIECHLRPGLGDWRGSPAGATRAMPVWEGQRVPAGMVPNEEDCGGLMSMRRLGFVFSVERSAPC